MPASIAALMKAGPAGEQALKEHHKVYEAYFYQGVNHGFHDDSTPRYTIRAAADRAWQRTLAWFEKYLRLAQTS